MNRHRSRRVSKGSNLEWGQNCGGGRDILGSGKFKLTSVCGPCLSFLAIIVFFLTSSVITSQLQASISWIFYQMLQVSVWRREPSPPTTKTAVSLFQAPYLGEGQLSSRSLRLKISEFLWPLGTLSFFPVNVKGENVNKRNNWKYCTGQVRLWFSLNVNLFLWEFVFWGGMSLIVDSENRTWTA